VLPSSRRSVVIAVAAAAAAATLTTFGGSPVSASGAVPPRSSAVGPTPGSSAGAQRPFASYADLDTRRSYSPDPAPTPPSGAVTRSLTDGMPGSRPNIVVIMSDDMREDELRWMPNVQHLIVDRGVHFVNSFAPYPLCCPSRASFLTGQYTQNHGVWTNGPPYGFRALHDKDTVATRLAAAGYRTAFLGKYLNGYGSGRIPGTKHRHSYHYVPPGWSDWRGSTNRIYGEGTPEAGGTYSYFATALNDNGVLHANKGVYQTRLLGGEAEDMVDELARSTRPFFLWASFVAPHDGGPPEPDDPRVTSGDGTTSRIGSPARPREVKGIFDRLITRPTDAVPERDMSDKPEYLRGLPPLDSSGKSALVTLARQRAEALYVLDQEVGRIVRALEAVGELDNTLLVFTSDNGYMLGEHRVLKSKRLPYEPSIRVPTVMAGPGIPKGVVRRDPIMNIDFEPTFLDLAGAPPDRTDDGMSLLEVARDGDRGWTRPVFTETGPLELPGGSKPPLEVHPGGPSALRFTQGVRTARYLYVEHATGERELYDLRRDPSELDSVVTVPAYRQVVGQLARVLEEMRMCRAASCREPLPRSLREP
jgi:N-acetylglucosamine-6-sulfatase